MSVEEQSTIEEIQSYLNKKGNEYLNIINQEYGQYLNPSQLLFMQQLLQSDNVVVEENGNKYIENQQQEIIRDTKLTEVQKQEEISKLNIPLAHGGRVFEDNKIHFYPSMLLSENPNLSVDKLKQKCDEVLIHELLHFFIRPENLDITSYPELKGINSFATEGLVDMCTRDIQQKYGLFPNYNSEYGTNVIFVREALSNIFSLSERMQLVFKGSIKQIYQQTSTQMYNTQEQYIRARDKKTKYDEVITNISRICYPEKKQTESCQRILYNLSANFKSKNEALEAIEKISHQQFSDKIPLIQQQIMAYKGASQSEKLTYNSKSNEITPNVQKKPFDQRSPSEIQVAEQIRIKNQAIAHQKKQQAKNKKTLVKTNPNSSLASKGYANVVILSLIMSFLAGILTMIIYTVLN